MRRCCSSASSAGLDATVTDDQLRVQIYQKVSPDELELAVAEADRLVRPPRRQHFDLLAQRYSYLRQCVPAFLAVFAFHSAPADQAFSMRSRYYGVATAQAVAASQTTPRSIFVLSKWRRYVLDDQDRIDRRYYELSALWELRAALRAGDVWVDHGPRRGMTRRPQRPVGVAV